jgi:pimeloyl-ACP methyl ester carboxylesterase
VILLDNPFQEEIINIGKELEVALVKRITTSQSTLIFIHGYGSSKDFFRFAFTDPSLTDYSLIAFDLIGFGDSSKPENFSYEMSNQASVLIQVINSLEIDTFHLCAHSMGGLVGLEMITQSPPQVLSFINLEGNLTLDDCFFSGKIIEQSFGTFKEFGRDETEKGLTSMPSYFETFKKASTTALYRSAEWTVKDSQDQALIQNFIQLQTKKCYIYGEKNRGVFPAEQQLLKSGIPVFYVKDSSHTMAEENPSDLYLIISKFIEN